MSSKKSSSSSFSSYEEVSNEEFNWTDEETNKEYIKFPLKKWHDIVYEYQNYTSTYFALDHGNIYKNTVNKILKEDVFKGEKFYEENPNHVILSEDKEISDYINNEFPKILEDKLGKNKNKWIKPDFIVWNINKKKFFEIIEERKYMMYFNEFNIPEDIDTINIIGEIKIRKSQKSKPQQDKYELFIKNYKKKYFILMNVYDVSYKGFLNSKKNSSSEIPQIICYIPRTYLNDCYDKFNEILKMKHFQPIEWEISEEYIKNNINILNQTLNEKNKNLENLENLKKILLKKESDLNEDISLFKEFEKIFIKEKNNLLEAQEELKNKKKIFEKDNTKKLDQKEEDLKKEKEILEKKEEEITSLEKELNEFKQQLEKINKEKKK